MNDTALFDRLGDPDRMRHLAEYDVFDPELRGRLDAVAAHTAEQLHAPVSMVSVLLDSSQFILGGHGVSGWVGENQGLPAEWSLCAQTVLADRPYVVADRVTDPEHSDNPLLTAAGLRSYAGVPIDDDSGQTLGAHCVIDAEPRDFTEAEIAVLTEGAAETMRILAEYRR